MSKRSINILIAVIIVGLLAAIFGYFTWPSFHNWVTIWLGDPTGLAASATTLAALATLFAVLVGLRGIQIGRELAHNAYRQAGEAIEENHKQFLEAQFNTARPLVVPVSYDSTEQYDSDQATTFDWSANYVFVTIQNVGTGVATNVYTTLLPPAPLSENASQFRKQLGSPIASGDDPFKVYFQPVEGIFDEKDSIGDYSLCIPSEKAGEYNARMCLTYQDIFGRKHASIFDLNDRGLWVAVAFLPNIEHDLGEINASKSTKNVVKETKV